MASGDPYTGPILIPKGTITPFDAFGPYTDEEEANACCPRLLDCGPEEYVIPWSVTMRLASATGVYSDQEVTLSLPNTFEDVNACYFSTGYTTITTGSGTVQIAASLSISKTTLEHVWTVGLTFSASSTIDVTGANGFSSIVGAVGFAASQTRTLATGDARVDDVQTGSWTIAGALAGTFDLSIL